MSHNFKLWFGCLGNGITVCNSAVTEHGDYKHIAHISNEGKIKLYVSENYIPDEDMQRIRQTAEQQKVEFLSYWNKLTDIQKYSRLINNYISHADFMSVCKSKLTVEEQVKRLEEIYIY